MQQFISDLVEDLPNFLLQLPTGQIKMQLNRKPSPYIIPTPLLQLPTGQIKMQLKPKLLRQVRVQKVATPHGSDKNAT